MRAVTHCALLSGKKAGNALDQASMVQMYAIFAWPQDQLRLLH